MSCCRLRASTLRGARALAVALRAGLPTEWSLTCDSLRRAITTSDDLFASRTDWCRPLTKYLVGVLSCRPLVVALTRSLMPSFFATEFHSAEVGRRLAREAAQARRQHRPPPRRCLCGHSEWLRGPKAGLPTQQRSRSVPHSCRASPTVLRAPPRWPWFGVGWRGVARVPEATGRETAVVLPLRPAL